METKNLKKMKSWIFETGPLFHGSNAKFHYQVFISHKMYGTGIFIYIYH